MQFNLVNDQDQVAQFVQRGLAWRSVSLHGISKAENNGCLVVGQDDRPNQC